MKLTAIADNTFREGVRQPAYLLILVFVIALLVLSHFLPFFTLGVGEDVRMFKDVGLAYILMGLLVITLLLASKVVDEEIENKTTLTLMSKTVRRWELIVGKFAGVMMAVTLALAVCGALLLLLTWLRVPTELRIDVDTTDEEQFAKLSAARHMHLMSLLPGLVLIWLQIAVMASIAVAISTRAGMVLNMVAGITLFMASHLTPFLAEAVRGRAGWQQKLAGGLVIVLPNLENFNLNNLLIYKELVFDGAMPGPTQFAYGELWGLVGLSSIYAGAYVAAALLIAMALFRTRELG